MNDEIVEKRQYLRFEYETPLSVKLLQNNVLESVPSCFSQNISSSGLLFASPKQFSVGTLLALRFDLSVLSNLFELGLHLVVKDDETFARVVRVEENLATQCFLLGVCFLCEKDFLESDAEELFAILNKKLF